LFLFSSSFSFLFYFFYSFLTCDTPRFSYLPHSILRSVLRSVLRPILRSILRLILQVVKTALTDAFSVSGLLMTTEAMIADSEDDKGPGGMGGMGGMGGTPPRRADYTVLNRTVLQCNASTYSILYYTKVYYTVSSLSSFVLYHLPSSNINVISFVSP
jgi:hypothetical protein